MITHVQPEIFSDVYQRPFTPAQAARCAIREGRIDELRDLIARNFVHAFTQISNGETLIRRAVQRRNLEAFNALASTISVLRINQRDAEGNALIHHLVLDEVPFETPDWAHGLHAFLGRYGPFIDWNQMNDEGMTAPMMLAADGERDGLWELFSAHMPMDSEDEPEEGERPVTGFTGRRARHA